MPPINRTATTEHLPPEPLILSTDLPTLAFAAARPPAQRGMEERLSRRLGELDAALRRARADNRLGLESLRDVVDSLRRLEARLDQVAASLAPAPPRPQGPGGSGPDREHSDGAGTAGGRAGPDEYTGAGPGVAEDGGGGQCGDIGAAASGSPIPSGGDGVTEEAAEGERRGPAMGGCRRSGWRSWGGTWG